VAVRRLSDNTVITTTTAASISFTTTANTSYVLERTAKPLSSYTHTQLTGSANQDVKTLLNTSSTLGLSRTPNPMINDTQLTYDANWHASSGRGYGDYNDDVHHSEVVGATASYTFTGTGVDYLSERNGDMGNADVYIDNVLQTTVNLNATGARQVQQVVYTKSGLASGNHTIKIVNKTTSVGMIDALRIHS
jgi:hypothetical protein